MQSLVITLLQEYIRVLNLMGAYREHTIYMDDADIETLKEVLQFEDKLELSGHILNFKSIEPLNGFDAIDDVYKRKSEKYGVEMKRNKQ